jgi:hypothetical protein
MHFLVPKFKANSLVPMMAWSLSSQLDAARILHRLFRSNCTTFEWYCLKVGGLHALEFGLLPPRHRNAEIDGDAHR